MGNTVRTFSTLGTRESEKELDSKQKKLGEALNTLNQKERLGDFLAKRADGDDIDPVEAVREVREDI